MPGESSGIPTPNPRLRYDAAYRSRRMRIIAPIYALLMLGNVVWAIFFGGGVVIGSSILFAGAVLGLLRLRRPMDTWPEWLFTYKP